MHIKCEVIMEQVLTAHRYRLFPTEDQKNLLEKTFGCCRFVYNYFLDYRIKLWKQEKKSVSYTECASILKALKNELTWLADVSSVPLQQTLRNLQKAYSSFFATKRGFPSFKKKFAKQSASFMKNSFRVVGDKIFLAKSNEPLNIVFSRPLCSEPTSITITKDSDGSYHISFCMKKEVAKLPENQKAIGLDLGISSYFTDQNGFKIEPPKYFEKSLRHLRRLQKKVSRKEKKSANRNKARMRLAKMHAKIRNKRNDFLHKLTTQLVYENQVIAVESLSVKRMAKNKNLSRAIADCGWSTFIRFLEYKCDWFGRILTKVDTFFPSSKKCCKCGWINQDLQLSDRNWKCGDCKSLHDRDQNAAINILEEGLNQIKVPWGSRELTPAELM